MTEQETPRIVQHADDAYESIRAINHATDGGIPAPVVYQVLGNLKTAGGYGLAQALEQLARGLGQSLDGYDVYEDGRFDPARAIVQAVDALLLSARDARGVGEQVDRVRAAIARQGYRRRVTGM